MTMILIIKLNEREILSNKFQEIISAYGCYIKTRIGLHDVDNEMCSTTGIIILQMPDKKEIIKDMIKELNSIKYIQIEKIHF